MEFDKRRPILNDTDTVLPDLGDIAQPAKPGSLGSRPGSTCTGRPNRSIPLKMSKALEFIIGKMTEATERADREIEDALAFVDASNQRITLMEAKGKAYTTR